MADYNTYAQLKMKSDFRHLKQKSDSYYRHDYIDNKNKNFLVVTEDMDIFEEYLDFFNVKKEDLPTVIEKCYKPEFLLKNVEIIQDIQRMFLTKELKEEAPEYYEEYKNHIDSLPQEYATEKDKFSYHYDYMHYFSSEITTFLNGKAIKYPSIKTFKDYPENAFNTRELKAFVFETKGTSNMKSHLFDNYYLSTPDEDYLNHVFFAKDAWKYFNAEKYYDVWHEEVEQMVQSQYEGTEKEPIVVFGFG